MKPVEWILVALAAFTFGAAFGSNFGPAVFVGASVIVLAYGLGLWVVRTLPARLTEKAKAKP